MTTAIQSFMNPSIGISELMQMRQTERLPQIRELSPGDLRSTGLDILYGQVNIKTAVESLLCPSVGDGSLVSPEVFSRELEAIVEKLKKSPNVKIRTMLEREILPLLENGMLLSAYRGLMIGG